jgi:phosphatidylserine decarboxylase precursor
MVGVMKQLRDYLQAHPDFKADFEKSFRAARSQGIPQFDEYNLYTFDEYLNYCERFLKWTPSENSDGRSIYNHICMFYFVIDTEPVSNYQNPIVPQSVDPSRWEWLTKWLISYANEVGTFMDKPESMNADSLATFYKAPSYHMEDYPVPRGGWKTFNQFFARHIRPAARPIDAYGNSRVIVSPADSTFDGSWPIDEKSHVSLKGIPWNIVDLLKDSDYGERFKGGKFMHAFLAPYDYHRQHAPVRGKVLEAKVIPGICYLEVIASPDENGPEGQMKLEMRRKLEAPDDPGYQFMQARGLILIDNPEIGLVAVLPIGMCQVSSVVLSVNVGDEIEKGDEISYFQLGGSDIVVVFEARSNVTITAKEDEPYNFGQKIAIAEPLPQQ